MTVPFVAVLLNAGLSANGNGRRAYLVLDAAGAVAACIRDDGRGYQCLRDRYPSLNCFTEIKTTATEIREWVKHCEALGK